MNHLDYRLILVTLNYFNFDTRQEFCFESLSRLVRRLKKQNARWGFAEFYHLTVFVSCERELIKVLESMLY